jgi:threonine dehydratase
MRRQIGYTPDSTPPPYSHPHHIKTTGTHVSTLPHTPSLAMSSNTSSRPLTRASVLAAHELIKPHIHRTPILTNTTLTTLASTPQTPEALVGTQWEGQEPARPNIRLFFKCENFQRIGAFKVRGAFHAVLRLIEEHGLEEVQTRGVVTHSSGI